MKAGPLFHIAAVFNFLVGIPMLVAYPVVARLLGLEGPPTVWFHIAALVVVIFGGAYWCIARDPVKFRPYVHLGIVAKLAFVAAIYGHWLAVGVARPQNYHEVRTGTSVTSVCRSAMMVGIIYSYSIHPRRRSVMRPTPREQVLRLLAVEPAGLRAPELADRVRPRISQPTLWRLLDSLRSEGRITVEGRGRATRYHSASRTDAAALRSLRLHHCAARRLAGDPALREVVR
jgi:hypothetical protein